jgi:hypothetical protein
MQTMTMTGRSIIQLWRAKAVLFLDLCLIVFASVLVALVNGKNDVCGTTSPSCAAPAIDSFKRDILQIPNHLGMMVLVSRLQVQ